MKYYIKPQVQLRPFRMEGMLCVSMRQHTPMQLNTGFQSGSSTDGELNFVKAVHPEYYEDNDQ